MTDGEVWERVTDDEHDGDVVLRRDDAFPNDVRQGQLTWVVNDRPCVSREGCVSTGGL